MHTVVVNFLSQVNFCFSFVFVYGANKVETKGKKLPEIKKLSKILLIILNSSFNLEVLISFDFLVRKCPLKTKQFRESLQSVKRKILFTLNS